MPSKSRIVVACLFAVASLPWMTSSAQAQTKLRWQFQQGQVFHQAVQQDMKMMMNFGGQNIETTMNQTVDAVWKVGAVDQDGTAEITQEFTRIRMKMMAAGGIGFDFDSSKDEELTGVGAVLGPALKGLAKSRFTLKMTPQGELKDVEVSQETIDAFKALPGAGQMGGMFSKEGLVNMVKQGSHAFPEEAVQPGDQWTTKSEIDLPQVGTMNADTKLTYAGPEQVKGKQLERINLEVSTKLTPKEGAGTQVTLKDQKATGKIYFDNRAGWLAESTLVQNMTMQIAIGGNNVDQKINQTINVRLTPAQD